jgi:hypothetical protein
MFHTVVTFGSPRRPIQSYFSGRDAEFRARQAAQEAKGTGSCSAARVYECDTRKLAITADISEVRAGERVVHNA